MDSQQYLDLLQEYIEISLKKIRIEVSEWATRIFYEDVRKPLEPSASPDQYMLRANQIGLPLLRFGWFVPAEDLYQRLLDEALMYRKESGEWRHVGALYANLAGIHVAQGDIDRGVVELLKAGLEDTRTYKVALEESYAIKDLLEVYFSGPNRDEVERVVQGINRNVTKNDVESLCKLLRTSERIREYAFLAYVRMAVLHEDANREFPNEFSQMQMLSALRNLSSLFEVELKSIPGNIGEDLLSAAKALYGRKSWWSSFKSARKSVGAIKGSGKSHDDQLKAALAITSTDDDSRFWNSLLIAYIARNYTIHQMDAQCALVQNFYTEVLGHVLFVMVTAYRQATSK
jgi:hypothetical protein